jgi:hypothetical protein
MAEHLRNEAPDHPAPAPPSPTTEPHWIQTKTTPFAAGASPRRSARKDRTSLQWEGRPEGCCRGGGSRAIPRGIWQDDDHGCQRSVPLLEDRAADERLGIKELGLKLEAGVDARRADHGVDASQVAGPRERHLRSPFESRWKCRPEPAHQANVPCISDPRARRVEGNGQLQSEHRGDLTQQDDSRVGFPALDPADQRLRHSNGFRDVTLAEARGPTSQSNRTSELRPLLLTAEATAIDWSFPGWHRRSIAGDAYRALTRGPGSCVVSQCSGIGGDPDRAGVPDERVPDHSVIEFGAKHGCSSDD